MNNSKSFLTVLKFLPLLPTLWIVTYLCLIQPNPDSYARPESVHPGLYCRYPVCRLPGKFWFTVYAPLIRLDRLLYPDRWSTRF
jgi:hypothetical protein